MQKYRFKNKRHKIFDSVLQLSGSGCGAHDSVREKTLECGRGRKHSWNGHSLGLQLFTLWSDSVFSLAHCLINRFFMYIYGFKVKEIYCELNSTKKYFQKSVEIRKYMCKYFDRSRELPVTEVFCVFAAASPHPH